MNNDDLDNATHAVQRGISNEKTRESLAVMMTIGAVLLAIIIGNIADSVGVGVLCMLAAFVPIWRYYSAPRRH